MTDNNLAIADVLCDVSSRPADLSRYVLDRAQRRRDGK